MPPSSATGPSNDDAVAVTVAADCRLSGVVDLTRPDRIGGWAIDRANPNAAVTVEIFRDGQPIGTVSANRHRPDLLRKGLGTGNYGYRLDLDAPIDPALAFTITAEAVTEDGERGRLRRIGRAVPPSDDQVVILLREIRATVAAMASETSPASGEGHSDETDGLEALGAQLERVGGILERIEIVQARLEAASATVREADGGDAGATAGLAWLVGGAFAVGFAALGLGVYSLLAG